VAGVCSACSVGRYKAAAGDGACVLCLGNTTTQEAASVSVTECVCEADFGLVGSACQACVRPAQKLHPGNEAGSSSSAGVCTLCARGTYKPSTGRAACSACLAPFSASLAGLVLASACTCPAGFIDNYGTEYVYVRSVGALSETDLNRTEVCQGYGDGVPCAVTADPARRLRAVVLSAAANATLRDVTVTVRHRGGSLLLYACTTDCEANATINLHGQPGALVIAASGSASAALSRHVGRRAVLSLTPKLISPAQAEAAVLRYGLRAGDAMWVPVTGGAAACELCPPGAVCL